jgi:stearoyl-CoA desaturase (delta-9 desaturase)
MTLSAALRVLPSTRFRRDKFFYLRYDLGYFVACSVALVLLRTFEVAPLAPSWQWWVPLALPLVIYTVILGHVFAHNASHANFPRAINRVVGELVGVLVLSRFASWQIIHERHHRYSDDVEKDPHPVLPSYWKTVWNTVVNVERQLQRTYLEAHGDTPQNRRRERLRAWVSYGTNVVLIACWYHLLGAAFFFYLFVPASIIGVLHLVHFNWSTHNALARNGDYKPVDLDEGLFRIGNWFFFGIYMHRVHHDRPDLFDPARAVKRGLVLRTTRPDAPAEG